MKKFLALVLAALLAFPAMAATPKVWYSTDGKTVWREDGKSRKKVNIDPMFVDDAGYHADSELSWFKADSAVWICEEKSRKSKPISIPLRKGEDCDYVSMNSIRTIALLSLVYRGNETLALFDTKGNKLAETPGVLGLGNGNSPLWIDDTRFTFTTSVHGTKRGEWGRNWHGAAVFEIFGEPGSGYFETLVTPLCEPTETVDYEAGGSADGDTGKCGVTKYTVKSPGEWEKEEPDFDMEYISVPLPAAG